MGNDLAREELAIKLIGKKWIGGRGDVDNRSNTISHIIEVENRLSDCLNKHHWRGTSSQKNGRVTKAVREWEQMEEGCGEPTMKKILCVRGCVQVWASVRRH